LTAAGAAEQDALQTRETCRLGWLALALTPEMGPTRSARAVAHLGSADRIFEAPLTELEAAGMPARSAQFCFDGRARTAAEQEIRRVLDSGGTCIALCDDEYPDRLRQIYDPPPVLWVRGSLDLLSQHGIAVVGTRHPSPYGSGMAEMLSRDLAGRGIVIQSGMARGIDTAAHKGALDAGGKTLAVWGTGIDVVYPKENKRLAERIVESGGAIISEFPLGTFPAPQNFPLRNRILSGVSVGVLVIEAGEYSGTRITARCAMEQNRDVYAVPGNVTNKNSWGPNTLIKQGAKLTATWEDVWEDLPSEIRLELETASSSSADESKASTSASLFSDEGDVAIGEHERKVLGRLRRDETIQLDDLIESLQQELGSAEIFTALFELELNGRIRQLPGKNYVRTF
jgi:DNA processing protein